MSKIYEAIIINFKRNKGRNGSVELRVKLHISGENMFFYTPTLFPEQENPWIDWTKQNSKGEPALKIRAGEMIKFQGEIIVNSGSSNKLVGEIYD